jgi:hypothetical protein
VSDRERGLTVVTVVKISMSLFWVVTLCRLVGRYKRSEEHTLSIFRVEN